MKVNRLNQRLQEITSTTLIVGVDISELLGMRNEDIDVAAGTIKGGTKTKAGKGRLVPIHHKIAPLIAARINGGGAYLFTIEELHAAVQLLP